MKMNRQGHDRVHLRAGTQVVVGTGRPLWLDEREACSLCMLCRKRRNKLNRYSDEQVRITVYNSMTGRSKRLIGMKV